MITKGDNVSIHGYVCEVLDTGLCEQDGCEKRTVTIIGPDGNEDTVHEDDCDGGGF